MSKVARSFYGAGRACSFGCRYCFAKFQRFGLDYPLPKFSEEHPQEGHIIYPTCDGEFFSDVGHVSGLERQVYSTRARMLVSISVKSPISDARARLMRALNDHLAASGRGLVKCSVSLSVKKEIERYEPHTPGYSERLESLKILSEAGIPRSVNIKPILPFVSAAEYSEIIADTRPYVAIYLLGGLYIDENTEFGREIKTQYSDFVRPRRVNWLPNRPTWDY